jgi:ATP-dependent Zn protease
MAKPKRLSKLELTAYHEAGHAVASLDLRRSIQTVTVIPDPDQDSLGHVKHHKLPNGEWLLEEMESGNPRRSFVEREIIIGIAGEVAETVARGKRLNQVIGSYEWEQAFAGAGMVSGSHDEAWAHMMWLTEHTKNLLTSQWSLVEEIAKALMVKKTLTGREVRQLYRSWLDNPPEMGQQPTPAPS